MKKCLVLSKAVKRNSLLLCTIGGVVVGISLGCLLRSIDLSEDWKEGIQYPGEIFMRLLQLIILPMIISSLITGSASLNARINGRMAGIMIAYILLTSLFNAILGVILAILIQPGSQTTDGMLELIEHKHLKKAGLLDSFLDLGRNLFPGNIFVALFKQSVTEYKHIDSYGSLNISTTGIENWKKEVLLKDGTNNLGVMVCCIVFGTVLASLGHKGKVVVEFFKVIDDVTMKIVRGIMWMTPIGVCSLICYQLIKAGDLPTIMVQLGWFFLATVGGVLFYQLVVMQLVYWLIVRKNPFSFYASLVPSWVVAFSTASAAAALPSTYTCLDESVRMDIRVSRFVLPIGVAINKDGTALFVAVACLFIAQRNGIELGVGEIISVIVTSTATSVAVGSIPSAALILIVLSLLAIGVPTNDVSLLFAIDWLIDRFRTTNNMLGDCYCAAVVEKLCKGDLDAIDAEVTRLSPRKKSREDSNVIVNENIMSV